MISLDSNTFPNSVETAASFSGPRLTGVWIKIAFTLWGILFLVCLLSLVLSLTSLNIWDRVPAVDLPRYFADMSQEVVAEKTTLQNETLQMGFSLPGFAYLLTAFRLIGSLPLFILSAMLVRRYSRYLMAMLLAALVAVMGASGIWNNTLMTWASALAPWMTVPGQFLSVLLWLGVIVLYAFPDGQFTPRWTIGLAIAVIPLAISLVFDLKIFLNPDTWPNPLPLLPNLILIGAAFFSVLYRYAHTANTTRKQQLKGFVVGASLLMTLYFILFFITDIYPQLTGGNILQTTRAVLIYVLISEPLWFILELVFAVGAGRSIFRDRLLEA